MNKGISLYELQQQIKGTIEASLSERYWVQCEIHDLKSNLSGHCYLDLVDKGEKGNFFRAKCSGIIWSSRWRVLSQFFEQTTGQRLSAGMSVLLQVQVQYSEMYGLSLIVYDIDPAFTIGEMEILRQQTIDRLTREGLMDMNSSLPLPKLPKRFAVISAEGAAGYGDFMEHLHKNPYGFKFYTTLYSAPMQGTTAPAGIIASLDDIASDLDAGVCFDAVLILRGGGSVADLLCFDDYQMCSHIAQFPIPVMSAIGHDRDFHICDMVAAVSVKTPTALADYIVDAFVAEDASLQSLSSRISMAVANKITAAEMVLKDKELKIRNGVGTKFINEFNALDMIELRIKRGNPLSILKMGYSLVMGDEGKILSIEGLEEGNGLKIVFEDGIVDCTINKIKQQKMTDYE